MGVFSRGTLSVHALRLSTDLSLARLSTVAAKALYKNTADKPGQGWGGLSDDGELGSRASSSINIDPGRPSLGENHNGFATLALRLYFDEVSRALIRRRRVDDHWTAYHERVAVDMLITEDRGVGEYTVLAATRKEDQLKQQVVPALEGLIADESTGSLKPISINEELDPDLFLWLIAKQHYNEKISDDLALAGIDRAESRLVSWRSSYSGGASADRGDVLANVAKGAQFGPAKVDLYHFDDPSGYFVMKLELDGGFLMYRQTEYDDKDIKQALSPEALGKRQVEDVWQVILPKIRSAYAADTDWRSTRREEFVQYAKAELRNS